MEETLEVNGIPCDKHGNSELLLGSEFAAEEVSGALGSSLSSSRSLSALNEN